MGREGEGADDDVPYQFLTNLRVRNPLIKQCFSEFIGTFLLIFFVDSAVSYYGLSGQHGDHFAVAFAAGTALYMGVIVGVPIGCGQMNPAVALALASIGKCPWNKVLPFCCAQLLGGFVGTFMAYANNYKAIAILAASNSTSSAFDKTAGFWTTFPGETTSVGAGFFDQLIGTAILLYAIMALIDHKNVKPSPTVIALALIFVLAALIIAMGRNGGDLNPARNFSGRIFAWMAGYPKELIFNGHYWWVVGILGPMLGGVLGSWVYYLLIELHHETSADFTRVSTYELGDVKSS